MCSSAMMKKLNRHPLAVKFIGILLKPIEGALSIKVLAEKAQLNIETIVTGMMVSLKATTKTRIIYSFISFTTGKVYRHYRL